MRRGLDLTTSGWHGLITSEDMLSPEQKASDAYVNEVEAPAGLGPKAGIFLVSLQPELALPLTLERPLNGGPFLAGEIARLNRLMSTIDAGARMALKVGFEASVRLADSLAPIGAEIALLNGSGSLIHSPPSWHAPLLASSDRPEAHCGDPAGSIIRPGRRASSEGRSFAAPPESRASDSAGRADRRRWPGYSGGEGMRKVPSRLRPNASPARGKAFDRPGGRLDCSRLNRLRRRR